MSKVIYISGPITGMPDGNYKAFADAEELLEEQGFIVLNKCSECGCCVRAFSGEVFLDYGQEWNYCPNCGAKMDEVTE